jgi:uncharacterized OsmC-like protein
VADPDRDDQEVLPGLDPRVRKRVVSQEAQTVNVRKMLHRGTVREFVFYSDEPPDLWGEDEHPRPLDYLLASVGF